MERWMGSGEAPGGTADGACGGMADGAGGGMADVNGGMAGETSSLEYVQRWRGIHRAV
jgi:hypothetical protein